MVLDGKGCGDEIFYVESCNNVVFADMKLQNCPIHAFSLKGELNVSNITIYNCHIHNVGERYIKGTRPVAGNFIRGGGVKYCLLEQDAPKSVDDVAGGDYVAGIDMMAMKDFTISDNTFLGIRGRNQGGRGAVFLWV